MSERPFVPMTDLNHLAPLGLQRQHDKAIAAGYKQCPTCAGGWLRLDAAKGHEVCDLCIKQGRDRG